MLPRQVILSIIVKNQFFVPTELDSKLNHQLGENLSNLSDV